MRIKKRSADQDFEMPLIPMIDMMFVLLLFFLVATTLKKTDKELPMQLPQSGAAVDTEQRDDTLVIGVDRNGQKYLATEPVSTDLLMQKIAAAAAENPNRRVRVDADANTPYKSIVELLEMCEFNNLKNVGFHTKSQPR